MRALSIAEAQLSECGDWSEFAFLASDETILNPRFLRGKIIELLE